MKIQIQGRPVFSFYLSSDEVDALIKLALLHYDMACKRTAGPDGVLQQWKKEHIVAKAVQANQAESEEPYIPRIEATFRELDLVCKICEPSNMVGLSDHLKETASKVYMAFMQAMNAANTKHAEWHHEIQTGH